MFKFFSRLKLKFFGQWLEEFSSGSNSEVAIKKIIVPGGAFYFFPSEGQELPVISTMYKSLADEDPPLPNRTKVVMILAPAGSDRGGLICELVDDKERLPDQATQEKTSLDIIEKEPESVFSLPVLATKPTDVELIPLAEVFSIEKPFAPEDEAIFEISINANR